MFALLALGGVAGAFAAPSLCRRMPTAAIVIGAFWIEAVGVGALVLTHDPYLLGVIAAAASFPAPAWNAVVVGARLSMTPDRLRSRVTAAARLLSGAMVPLGALAAGLLIAAYETTTTLLAFAGWQAAVAAASTASRPLREAVPI